MYASKLNFSENFMGCCIRSPTSLKEQMITKIAVQLCQNMNVRKYIINESKALRRHKETSVKEIVLIIKSKDMCSKLPLPHALKDLLIVRYQSLALQLFSWNTQQAMFKFSSSFADSLLTPSDWTVEGRLDENKIAERLVQDERIPVCQRYKIACLHCLETFICSLWNEISISRRTYLRYKTKSVLVRMWSDEMARRENDLDPNDVTFWYNLFLQGSMTGSRSTVFHCWDKGHISETPSLIVVSCYYIRKNMFEHFDQFLSLTPYMDILCFLLTQMSKEQRVEFFEEALLNDRHNILVWFLQWPYLDFLLPLIRELWGVLPMVKYGNLLLSLAYSYSNEFDYSTLGYINYNYGDLMVDLLEETPDHFKRYIFREETPDHFKRYIFRDNDHTDTNPVKILYMLITKKTLKNRNIKIFQRIWQQVSLEEKRSFLKSRYGESFRTCLQFKGNWDLLDSLLRECFPEDDVTMIQKCF